MKYYLYVLLLVLLVSQCRNKEPNYSSQFPGKPGVPSAIKNEHDYLLEQMHTFTLFQDSTGLVALKLDSLMQHHFQEEEDFVLPPLGHLPSLASGEIPEHSKEVIQLTEKLKSQLTHMSVEHQLIKAYLGELKQAANHENNPEIIEFEKQVHKHATTEEEVFFPAAIQVGEYLKLKSLPNQ
jgi:hypothetical protein